MDMHTSTTRCGTRTGRRGNGRAISPANASGELPLQTPMPRLPPTLTKRSIKAIELCGSCCQAEAATRRRRNEQAKEHRCVDFDWSNPGPAVPRADVAGGKRNPGPGAEDECVLCPQRPSLLLRLLLSGLHTMAP